VTREWRRWQSVSIAVLALVFSASPLFGQLAVTPGTRVRIAIPDTVRQVPLGPTTQLIYGTVTASTLDTLYVTVVNTQGSLAVPRTSVRSLAVSRGLPSRGRSVAVNGLKSALLGAGVWYLLSSVGHDDPAFGSRRNAALAGAGFGLALGAYFGASRPVEQWRVVPLR
jgi:hypothetical protein